MIQVEEWLAKAVCVCRDHDTDRGMAKAMGCVRNIIQLDEWQARVCVGNIIQVEEWLTRGCVVCRDHNTGIVMAS